MTKWQKIRSILAAVCMVLLGVLLLFLNSLDMQSLGITEIRNGELPYLIILLIMTIVLLVYGIRLIFFYFTMARCMTGGRSMLYRGVLFIELALFSYSLQSVPTLYLMSYFSALLLFSGAVDVFGAFDAYRLKGSWILKMVRGLVTIAFAIYAFLHLQEPSVVVLVFCVYLFYSALMRIISAVTETKIITIQ